MGDDESDDDEDDAAPAAKAGATAAAGKNGSLDDKFGDLKKSIEEIKQKIDKGITTVAPKVTDAAKQDNVASGIVSRIQDKIVQLAKGGDSPAVEKHLEAIDARLDDIEDRLSKVEEGEGTTPAAEDEEETTTAGDEDVTTTGGEEEDETTTGGD